MNKYIVVKDKKIPFSTVFADCSEFCFPVSKTDNLNDVIKKICDRIKYVEGRIELDPHFTSWLATDPLSSFVVEAPEDGVTYGRKDGEWVEIVTTETDPVFTAWLATNPFSTYITEAPTDGTTYGRLNGNWTPIVTVESDPIFLASDAASITSTDISNWNTAFGWGDHSLAGYLTSETDPLFSAWLLTNPLSAYVPLTREITINGVTYDLSVDRTWTIDALPPQAGNNGKVLFTNGVSASWEQFDYIQDATPTGTIKVGARWFKTDTGREYTYVDDGTSSQWVEQTLPTATGPAGPSGPNNISTSTATAINAILKGNGLNVEAAIPNTDYQVPIGYTPENQANKETVTLDNNVTKYPNNNVVKTALDAFADDVDYAIMTNQRILFNF